MTTAQSLILMRGLPQLLASQGWEVHIVSGPGAEQAELAGVPGVTTHTIAMKRDPSPIADLADLTRWLRLLGRIRPDVTSVGTPKAGLLGGIAAFLMRVPRRIYHLRGLRLETVDGPLRVVLTLMERLSCKASHVVLAVSHSLAAEVGSLRLAPPEKVRVLGAGSSNGVDIDRFAPGILSADDLTRLASDLGLEPRVPVIGFVGRLTEDKGLRELSTARRVLGQRGIDHQLLVIGQSENSSRTSNSYGSESSERPAVATGHVSDTAPYYQLMDVLCLPTRREGFPNVVLEAAASGVPTVTTNATGAVDSVVDGVTGLVVPVGSESDLAEALATLLGSKTTRAQMGRAALERVKRDFDRRVVGDNIAHFYADQLADKDIRETIRIQTDADPA